MKKRGILKAGIVTILVSITFAGQADKLESDFENPPDWARPQTWWHWMNGNISREGIVKDLAAMQRVGVGGAQIFNTASKVPEGTVPYNSQKWRELVAFAVAEGDRLGLQVGMHNCAGWSSSGGPWVKPEESMQVLLSRELLVEGAQKFSGALPTIGGKHDSFRDVAVIAFKTPEAEPNNFFQCLEKISSTGDLPGLESIADLNYDSHARIPLRDKERPEDIIFEMNGPFTATAMQFLPDNEMAEDTLFEAALLASNDGKTYKPAAKTKGAPSTAMRIQHIDFEKPVTAKYFKLQVYGSQKTKPGAVAGIVEFSLSGGYRLPKFYERNGYSTIPKSYTYSLNDKSVPVGAKIDKTSIVDLTDKMDASGNLQWKVPSGKWTIMRIGHCSTGMVNHPDTLGGTGLECDKLSRKAVKAFYDGIVTKVLAEAERSGGKMDTLLIDSYEVGPQNWSPVMMDEFVKRRGYSPLPYLPVMFGRVVDNVENSERFLEDIRLTVAELFAENYYGYMRELAQQDGLELYFEGYSSKSAFNWLDCLSKADVPMAEFWVRGKSVKHKEVQKAVSSAAHAYGRKVVAAEAFTGAQAESKWQQHPYYLKQIGDEQFCTGINRFVYHSFAHDPWHRYKPGMTMGRFGTLFSSGTTWWEPGRAWQQYNTRCQYLFQSGQFIADIACYIGEATPVRAPERKELEEHLPEGYDYDLVGKDTLLNRMSVENGQIAVKGGMHYEVLYLTQCEQMSVEVLKRLAQLSSDGAIIVGDRPVRTPGLTGDDQTLKALADKIWGGGAIRGDTTVANVLEEKGILPDFVYEGRDGKTHLTYIHHQIRGAEFYFVANRNNWAEKADLVFRVSGKQPELWFPTTGKTEKIGIYKDRNGTTTVPLHLRPFDSVFVVFKDKASGGNFVKATAPAQETKKEFRMQENDFPLSVELPSHTARLVNGKLEVDFWKQGTYRFQTLENKTVETTVRIPPEIDLSKDWKVAFPPNLSAPESVLLDNLIPLNTHGNDGVKYFSGTATYTREFEVTNSQLLKGNRLHLDLGTVRVMAEVLVNGQNLGILWQPPFVVDVTNALQVGKNQLEIRVTNLWINRRIGDAQLPDDCGYENRLLAKWPDWVANNTERPQKGKVTFAPIEHWSANSKLVDSGLIGPVRIRTVVRKRIEDFQ